MKIYEKVVRKIKNKNWDISDIIRKDTLRKIRKDIEKLKTENIIFGIERLSEVNLMNFYENIYLPIIGKKDNAKTNLILEKLTPEEIKKGNRFFIFIKKENTLLGWWICNYINNSLKFSYKANLEEEIDLKAWFWTIIDFIFFSFWLEKSVEYFSYWVDRNWYWGIGSAPWVCLHKLLLWCIPYTPAENKTIEINEKEIKEPTIIFDLINKDWEFSEAILLNYENNIPDILIKKWFKIIQKKWQ